MHMQVRSLTVDDAENVARLYNQSATHLRSLGDTTDFQFSAEVYRRDGFDENPAFAGIGAEYNGELVGYLLYTFGYDTDRALRILHVIDLLVDQQMRGQGIGRMLMDEAAAICRRTGGGELFWAVYDRNLLALRFYRGLGADEITDLRFMRLNV